MQRTVYKYPLRIAERMPLEIHNGFQPLSVQMQNGVPCLWAAVDTTKEISSFAVRMVGTGNGEIAPRDTYLGTVQQGAFVWHFFLVGAED